MNTTDQTTVRGDDNVSHIPASRQGFKARVGLKFRSMCGLDLTRRNADHEGGSRIHRSHTLDPGDGFYGTQQASPLMTEAIEIYDMENWMWHRRQPGDPGPNYQTICGRTIRTSAVDDPSPTGLLNPSRCPECYR